MSLFNSSDPAIAAAHAKVLDTLANIETEYGAVFVIDQEQQELRDAVAANHRRNEEAAQLEEAGGGLQRAGPFPTMSRSRA